MTDERYKKIMADLGMPNSRSLLVALQQVANEAGQECAAAEREACAKVCETPGLGAKYQGDVYAEAIRMRSNVKLMGDPPALSAERPSRMEGSTP